MKKTKVIRNAIKRRFTEVIGLWIFLYVISFEKLLCYLTNYLILQVYFDILQILDHIDTARIKTIREKFKNEHFNDQEREREREVRSWSINFQENRNIYLSTNLRKSLSILVDTQRESEISENILHQSSGHQLLLSTNSLKNINISRLLRYVNNHHMRTSIMILREQK